MLQFNCYTITWEKYYVGGCDNAKHILTWNVVIAHWLSWICLHVHCRYSQASSSTPTWLDNVGCLGTESRLASCSHRGYGNEDCSHSEDIALICSYSSKLIAQCLTVIGLVTTETVVGHVYLITKNLMPGHYPTLIHTHNKDRRTEHALASVPAL